MIIILIIFIFIYFYLTLYIEVILYSKGIVKIVKKKFLCVLHSGSLYGNILHNHNTYYQNLEISINGILLIRLQNVFRFHQLLHALISLSLCKFYEMMLHIWIGITTTMIKILFHHHKGTLSHITLQSHTPHSQPSLNSGNLFPISIYFFSFK